MQDGVSAWYSCLSVQLEALLVRLLHISSKTVGQTLESSFQATNTKRMLSLAGNIAPDSSILFEENQLFPSNRGVPQALLNRLQNCFVPQSVKLLNQSLGSK